MWFRCLSAVAVAALTVPAVAETPEQLDQLVVATPVAGLALAREQSQAGNLLLALSTIENVLFASPTNTEARLVHEVLLCRLGDLPGAAVPHSTLKRTDYPHDARQKHMSQSGRAPSRGGMVMDEHASG